MLLKSDAYVRDAQIQHSDGMGWVMRKDNYCHKMTKKSGTLSVLLPQKWCFPTAMTAQVDQLDTSYKSEYMIICHRKQN